MQASQFLRIANYLRDNRPGDCEEAADRTAVSRIYYAAFLYARRVLEDWGCGISQSGSTHAQVVEGLKWSATRPISEVGKKLGKLHEKRKSADYDIDGRFEPDFERLCQYYETATSLEERWNYLNDEKKEEALSRMKARIAEI